MDLIYGLVMELLLLTMHRFKHGIQTRHPIQMQVMTKLIGHYNGPPQLMIEMSNLSSILIQLMEMQEAQREEHAEMNGID